MTVEGASWASRLTARAGAGVSASVICPPRPSLLPTSAADVLLLGRRSPFEMRGKGSRADISLRCFRLDLLLHQRPKGAILRTSGM